MAKRVLLTLILFFLCPTQDVVLAAEEAPGSFLVLAYHNIPLADSPGDKEAVPQGRFVKQMEYLRTHGYHPVSMNDILDAYEGKRPLPLKPVLLTFDDAYVSYYDFVVPVLEKFGYPSVLAIAGSFIDAPPEGLPEPVMSWDQIREVASKRLVEVVSHSYDLHKGVRYNPAGNISGAGAVRMYDSATKTYETEAAYRNRIEADFKAQEALFARKLGMRPRGIAWPYGMYTALSVDIARKAGYRFCFTLEDGYANISRLTQINRTLVSNGTMKDFISLLKTPQPERMIRAVQVDLDMIYDPGSAEKTDENLGKLIERLVAMKVNTVFLQAFADPEGNGTVKSVYFFNRVLPVRADIFSHAAHQIAIRDMKVYAWMPTLGIELPDPALNESLRVQNLPGTEKRANTSGYKRLSPSDQKVRDIVRSIYEDLAAHSLLYGIVFQDDAYLAEDEDYHPSAISRFKAWYGRDVVPPFNGSELAEAWVRYKTDVLISFTDNLMEGVRKYRPTAVSARTLYAAVLSNPGSERWLAQNFERSLNAYNHVVVMAYPQMEREKRPLTWLKGLVAKARAFPQGRNKTVFEVQSYDWEKHSWINDRDLLEELRDILAEGGRHIAYYPDNLWQDRPKLDVLKLEMSTESYPFLKGRP